ncbi:hypothetical protein LPJ59_003734 [Coemansia sp. RSA 2399]|nr:hypothetical protein LPJ59_003734 [Coemansia sp. RSA 2399]
MTGNMYAGPVDAVQATTSHTFGAFIGNQGSAPEHTPDTTHDAAEAYPSRCESPLLPMGQSLSHQTGADRLSQQLGQAGNRQSQLSMARKDYAIHDDEGDNGDEHKGLDTADAKRNRARPHMNRPRMTMPRAKSYRIHTPGTSHTSPVRDLSSKFKSACRKLNPKRLGKSAQQGQHSDDGINDENHYTTTTQQRSGASSNRRGDHRAGTEQAHPAGSSPAKLS